VDRLICKHRTIDVNFYEREIRYCKIANYQNITQKKETYYENIIDYHGEQLTRR
jgi:hypothetical protein